MSLYLSQKKGIERKIKIGNAICPKLTKSTADIILETKVKSFSKAAGYKHRQYIWIFFLFK